MRDQVLDATLACVAKFGVAKTTLDDVAREAGCARATVYRNFGGKQQLLLAAVAREADRMADTVERAAIGTDTLVDAATAVVTTGAQFLLECDALTFVLTVEPDVLLPHISFDAGNIVLAEFARRCSPVFARFVGDADAARVGEWIVRIAFSYLCSPEAADMLDATRVRALMEDFVLPGFIRSHTNTPGVSA